jgi:hypothetical protein
MLLTLEHSTCPTKDELTLRRLGEIERQRALTPEESLILERAVRRMDRNRERDRPWTWSPAEDHKIRMFMAKRARASAPKPFRPNDEVRELAKQMGRTEWAVRRRMERLRKKDKGRG